jgi:hypothetical protein
MIQSVPRSKHCLTLLYKTSQLMLYNAKVTVCPEIRTKHKKKQCKHHVEFLNIKPGGT